MRRWLFYALLGLAGVVVAVVAVGALLPVRHTASQTARLAASPDHVFFVVSDFARYPEWRTDVERIEVSGGPGVGQLVREFGANGEIPYRVESLDPPARLVMRIADPALPFGGTWTYQLEPTGDGGTRLTLTEDGEVYNPVFRFMSRFVFGHDATIEAYLADLEARVASRPPQGSIFQNAMPPACLPTSTVAARVRVARS